MTKYNKTLFVLLLFVMTKAVMAQNGVNSPYTRYGFGQLSDQSLTGNRGMGGTGYGLRNKFINVLNPASYSNVDSITFIFDVGISLQNSNFSNGTTKMNVKNSSLDYVAMQFRLWRRIGMTLGFLPYSRINYDFSGNVQEVDVTSSSGMDEDSETSSYDSFSGEGGLRQIFAGIGVEVFKNFSVGFNFSYLYGELTHTIQTSYTNSSIYNNLRGYQSDINTYKLDLGFQYTYDWKERHSLTLGATYSLGHNVNNDAYKVQQLTYSSSAIEQSIDTITNAYQIPHTFGVGLTYVYDDRVTIGLDYTFQKWAGVRFPHFTQNGEAAEQDYEDWSFQNASRISMGVEYIHNPRSRNFFHRLRFRIGGYYSKPYISVKNSELKEYGIEGGVGIPIINSYNHRSILAITAQYVNVTPKQSGLIEEKYLRINIGLTFNEDWFRKMLVK